MSGSLGLQLMSINGVFFDGRVNGVKFPCSDGGMEILADHEEMFVAISEGVVCIKHTDGSTQEVVVSPGMAQIANNRCLILVDTAERPEDIDIRRAQEALEAAREHMRQKQSIREHRMSEAAMARALNRLKQAARYD